MCTPTVFGVYVTGHLDCVGPVCDRVQVLLGLKLPLPPATVKVTLPVGAPDCATLLTVAVQTVGLPTGTGLGVQLTVVVVAGSSVMSARGTWAPKATMPKAPAASASASRAARRVRKMLIVPRFSFCRPLSRRRAASPARELDRSARGLAFATCPTGERRWPQR